MTSSPSPTLPAPQFPFCKVRKRVQCSLYEVQHHPASSAGLGLAPGFLQTQVQGVEATISSHVLGGSRDRVSQRLAKGMFPRKETPFEVVTMVRGPSLGPSSVSHTHRGPFPVSHSITPVPSPILLFELLPSLPIVSTSSQHAPSSEGALPQKSHPHPQEPDRSAYPHSRGGGLAMNSRGWKPDLGPTLIPNWREL